MHEEFDGSVKRITIEREIDELCLFIPISNETIWADSYASRSVPKRCTATFVKSVGQIQPLTIHPEVETLAELEVLDFIENMQKDSNMMLIDTRSDSFYDYRTIPSAKNIPYHYITKKETFSKEFDKALKYLGVVEKKGLYDFSSAKTIALFCNGSWCSQSPSMIKELIKLGYPPKKIKWYRGGINDWLATSMTSTRP